MAYVNKVILMGNVSTQPIHNGNELSFKLATQNFYKDKQGEHQRITNHSMIKVYGYLIENCERYVNKGVPLYIEGRLVDKQISDEYGNLHTQSYVIADVVNFLSQLQKEYNK